MIAASALLILALLGPPASRTYAWRDSAGQTHITSTPPPPGAVILEPPPPPAIEPGGTARPDPLRQNLLPGAHLAPLTPAQQQAWDALNQHLAEARARGDRHGLEAVADSLIQRSLWGRGLWLVPLLPLLAVLLMGLMGWWLALGLRFGTRLSLIAGFLALGLAFGHLLLTTFLYHPQAARLRENMERLELHMGIGRPPRAAQQVRLQERYKALEQAAEPLQPPWRFPAEVSALRDTAKRVLLEP